MYKSFIDRFFPFSRKSCLHLDFDVEKKMFRISMPIFHSEKLPDKVKEYVDKRKNFSFRPHSTTYEIRGEKIYLTQFIGENIDFQASTRKDIHQFFQLTKHCRKILNEIAAEEFFS